MRRKSNSILKVPALAIGLIVLVTIIYAGSMNHRHRMNRAPLVVSSAAMLEIGEVWMQPAFVHRISLTNVSESEISVNGFNTSCTCAKIEPPKFSVAPGQSRDVTLVLNLQPVDVPEAHWDAKSLSIFLQPRIDNFPIQDPWELTGVVRQSFDVSRPTLDFGKVIVGEEFDPMSMSIRCHAPVSTLTVEFDREGVAVKVKRNGPSRFELLFTVGDIDRGKFTANAIIRGTGDDGTHLSVLKVPILANILHQISVLPEEIAIGTLKLGESKSYSLTLRPRVSRYLDVIDATTDSIDTEVDIMPGKGDAEVVCRVRQQATALGQQCSSLKFRFRTSESGPIADLMIPIRYYGIQ